MADKKADDKKMAPTVDQDAPGKMPEPAAPSGAEPVVEEGMAPLGQGAQVILTGAAQEAARGGTHGDVTANTEARDKAIADGHVADGTTAQAAADAMAGQHPMPADDDDPKLKPKKA
jgi:hypothetical protein